MTESISHDFQKDQSPFCPQFPSTNPWSIQTFFAASSYFRSIVSFVKAGNVLTDSAIKQACSFLGKRLSQSPDTSIQGDILHQLVPSPDGSCRGFVEHIIPLLTCNNQKIVNATLTLVTHVIPFALISERFDFVATGIFEQLPQSFYENEIHLIPQTDLYLNMIISTCLECSSPRYWKGITRKKSFSVETVFHTIFTQLVMPLKPYLTYLCRHKRQIEDSHDSTQFAYMLGTLLSITPFYEPTTQFVRDSPISLTFTSCFEHFETKLLRSTIISELVEGIDLWVHADRAVQQRGKLIQDALREEGLFDELDSSFLLIKRNLMMTHDYFICSRVIAMMGGNIRFVVPNV
ncbi:hypothetical protein BLNAU_20393 [Blattamonas nauphoetae]|uniref:Uncharacterized protein n=1 Tax=Blattamonas nauphoetae TaxID=2049346 RepID=A0ABQ9WZ10_9EUKA|nr:hypothetical protein BLNAU_20393 [Blattamonas nauphoetae]